MNVNKKNIDGVKSAERVFQIMELFQIEKAQLSAKNISEKLFMPRSSTNVLIKTMLKKGYLGYDQNDYTYFPTTKIAQLSEWALEHFFNHQEELDAICDKLSKESNETVSITVRSGDEAQFVKVIPGIQAVTLKIYEGSKTSLFYSACGLALLSSLNTEQVCQLANRYNKRIGESDKPVDVTELLEKLLVISKRLVAIDYEGVIKDAGAVSIGIPEHVFGKFIAISVSGPAQRIKNKEIDIENSLKAIILPYILKA
jgi:DNA-binding IclR family transcriptional regulator